MSEYIHKSNNASILVYHFVCPAKYRGVVSGRDVDKVPEETCLEIEKRYEMRFFKIGTDKDHVHLLIQSVSTRGTTKLINTEEHSRLGVLERCPLLKKKLWRGRF